MTSTGTGVGGNVGGRSIPLQRDIETTAWTEMNKAALGVVHDSIQHAFTEINPRYTTGFMGGFGYKTTSENPLLNYPLETQRRSELANQKQGNAWQQDYTNLVNQLPPDLLQRFLLEGNKPFEQQNLSFVALDNLFKVTAKALTQTAQAAQTPEATSLEGARATLNLLLPFAALKGVISTSVENLQHANDFLKTQGANYRHFDGFNKVIDQMQSPINLMKGVDQSLDSTTGGQLNPQAIKAASKAADQLATLRAQMERTSLGPDLQVVLTNVKALETVASALALPYTSSSPLFIALATASIGLYTKDSPAGLLGAGFETLVTNLNEGLVAALMPKNSKAGNDFLSYIVPLSLSVLTSLGGIAYQSGLGIYPPKDARDVDNVQYFAFQTALHLAVGSGFIETFYKEAIAISGGDAQAQEKGAAVLAMLANYLVILSGANSANRNPNSTIEGEAQSISRGIATAAILEREIDQDDVRRDNLNADTQKTVSLALAIKLSALALESKDYEGFIEATNDLLTSLNTSSNALKEDIARINAAAQNIAGVASLGDPNLQTTRIVNIV